MRSQIRFLVWSALVMYLTSAVDIPGDRGKSSQSKAQISRLSTGLASIFGASPHGALKDDSDDSHFVTAPGDGHLYLDDDLFDFRAFNTPTLLQRSEFEVRDLLETISGFGTPVTRTYTLQIANQNFEGGTIPPSEAHVIGWDKNLNDWKFNQTVWEQMDTVLDMAREYEVKLIIPIINQDYGTSDTNYVGNYNDLIRHRYNISRYSSANKAVDWFTDRNMIDGYKKLISYFLNRVNTVNGIRYGDDDTILAFETGNELNWGRLEAYHLPKGTPRKSESQQLIIISKIFIVWTLEIAEHLKSLAPKTLVMDGSYSRKNSSFWEKSVLESKFVDLFDYHLYGENDLSWYTALHEEVRAHGKTLIIGEHGFYSNVAAYNQVYKKLDCAGALIWSLRGHSDQSGFDTHSEGNNIFAYHAPGWLNQTSKDFDTQESSVISATYDASYAILGLDPPPKPVPGTPQSFFLTNGSHVGLSWRGSTWADRYEILGAHVQGLSFNLLSNQVQDNVGSGEVFIPLDPHQPTKLLIVHRESQNLTSRTEAGWIENGVCRARRVGKQLTCSINPSRTMELPIFLRPDPALPNSILIHSLDRPPKNRVSNSYLQCCPAPLPPQTASALWPVVGIRSVESTPTACTANDQKLSFSSPTGLTGIPLDHNTPSSPPLTRFTHL
ncbi:hypothetical protein PSHT_11702 [Puccinia striiformis]|uniref:mannan endo-1,4-beta-mannosidase n=1 Tax=Puccinia striiformis TaxID=27350 RepID=A0A2S4V1Q2_9BASI|nr:hypothetical protein PSHT_11702 [Puccinia striiformis]